MLFVFLCAGSALAQVLQIGDSVVIGASSYSEREINDSPAPRTAIMVSLATADGDAWFAVEYDASGNDAQTLKSNPALAEPEVDLWWWDGAVYRKQDLGVNRLDEAIAFHYPTIDTWHSTDYVYVLTKQDVNQPDNLCDTSYPCAQLESRRQDKDNMAVPWGLTEVHPGTPTNLAHARAHLSHELVTSSVGTQYACFTVNEPDDPAGDVYDDWWIKAKLRNQVWSLGYLGDPEEQPNDIEDHCQMGYDDEGVTFTVYHHCNVPGACPSTSDDHVHVRQDYYFASWVPPFWQSGSDVLLTRGGPAAYNADFPTIAVAPTLADPDPPYHVVVANDKDDPGQLFVWLCIGDSLGCDSASEWTYHEIDPPGISARQPQVVFADPPNIVIAFENENTGEIGFVAACDWTASYPGSVTFTSVGVADKLFGYDQYEFTPAPGTPVTPLVYDDPSNMIRASFVARRNTGQEYWDPVHFSAPISDFCP